MGLAGGLAGLTPGDRATSPTGSYRAARGEVAAEAAGAGGQPGTGRRRGRG